MFLKSDYSAQIYKKKQLSGIAATGSEQNKAIMGWIWEKIWKFTLKNQSLYFRRPVFQNNKNKNNNNNFL